MSNKHLYWAFQSSQTLNPTEEELKSFQRKYKKDFRTRELYEDEELENMFRLEAWRNPLFSHITSIILAFEHEGKLRVKFVEGEEIDLLQNFNNLLRNSFQDYQLATFDSEIVLPYIGVRLNKHGWIKPPHTDLSYMGLKPWNLTGYDLKSFYSGAGKYAFGLKDIADNFNLDSSEVIEVEDEFTHYNAGHHGLLKISAIKKVELIAKLHRILTEQPKLETVLVEERVQDVEEEKPTNWLETLYRENNLSLEIKAGIKELVGKKKLTKVDKTNLFTILRGIMVRTDFENMDQDSKAKIAQKELEINEFINTL